MGHWLFWYLTWAIWIRNEGVVPINVTEKSDIENDVVPPPLSFDILSKIQDLPEKYCTFYEIALR